MTRHPAPADGERILFLDVDGVLNFEDCWLNRKELGLFPIAPECVEQLDRVVAETGAVIVLSSAWREMPMLEKQLAAVKAVKVRHKDRSTKRLSRSIDEIMDGSGVDPRRSDEIREWLSRHPEVTSYAIVDDEQHVCEGHEGRYVLTDFHGGGLTPAAADQLIAILNREPAP